jgi:hypothetical protein
MFSVYRLKTDWKEYMNSVFNKGKAIYHSSNYISDHTLVYCKTLDGVFVKLSFTGV